MNKLDEFIEKFQTNLEEKYNFESEIYTQEEIKFTLQIQHPDEYPMICYEHTNDDNFEMSIDESKFLNDESHDGVWVFVENIGIICFKECFEDLEINVFEINETKRGEGFGKKLVECIEKSSEKIYNKIKVFPFDTEASNFWEHMCYINYKGFIEYVKEIF